MGRAIEIIGGQVTAPSSTITTLTMNSGNSATIRNTQEDSAIKMIGAWNKNQTAGDLRIRSPFLHDNVNGFISDAPAADVFNHLDPAIGISLKTQDTLSLGLSGSATSGDIEIGGFLIHYEDLPGAEQRLITFEELQNRMETIMGVQNTLATGTAGGWSGEEAIDAEDDQMKANRDYALIGYEVSAICGSVRWVGSDTSNLGVGGPGSIAHRQVTRSWFLDLARKTGLPMIPVINSANKSSTNVSAHQDEDGTDVKLTSIFALLSQ